MVQMMLFTATRDQSAGASHTRRVSHHDTVTGDTGNPVPGRPGRTLISVKHANCAVVVTTTVDKWIYHGPSACNLELDAKVRILSCLAELVCHWLHGPLRIFFFKIYYILVSFS